MDIYGFFYNSDTYDSAPFLMSAHRSLRGAYTAMRKHIVADYVEWFNDGLIYGKQYWHHKPNFGKAWFISKIELCE
jgi:hypothetical protein